MFKGTRRKIMFLFLRNVAIQLIGLGCSKHPSPSKFYNDPDEIALVSAVQSDDVKTIERLVTKGVNINAQGKKGLTPLFFALAAKKKNAFKTLLKLGADPNIRYDLVIGTVIHAAAAQKEDSEWLEMVLKHGGDPDAVNAMIFRALTKRLSGTLFGQGV